MILLLYTIRIYLLWSTSSDQIDYKVLISHNFGMSIETNLLKNIKLGRVNEYYDLN